MASDGLTRLSQGNRVALRVGGAVLAVGGLGLSLYGFSTFATAGAEGLPNLLPIMAMFMGGFIAFGVGMTLLRVGFLRAGAEILATETGGAVEYGSTAAARGLGRGLKESGFPVGGTTQVVRVKCRACGFLETEDARFCSRCAKPI